MKPRTWLILAAVLIVGGTAWAVLAGGSAGVPVEAAAARVGGIAAYVDERGKTRLPETHRITMPYAARIEPITLVEGTAVREGQAVARVVAKDLQLAVDEADAALDEISAAIAHNADHSIEQTGVEQALEFVKSMRATTAAAAARVDAGLAGLDYANADLKRIQQLRSSNATTEDRLQLAQLRQLRSDASLRQDRLVHTATQALEIATNMLPQMVRQYIHRKQLQGNVLEQQRARAKAQVEQAKLNLARGEMTSPVDGVVLRRHLTGEQPVAAGTVLLEIGQLDQLEVEAEVLSLEAVRIRKGQKVEVYGPAIGNQPAKATVARVEPAGFTKISSLGVEQQRVLVIVRFEPGELQRLRSDRHLGVGYRVRVRVFTAEKPQTLVVPRSALFRGLQGDWQLYAVVDGRARLRTVKVGLINDSLAEITDGVAEDDAVILAPEGGLTDGAKVAMRGDKS